VWQDKDTCYSLSSLQRQGPLACPDRLHTHGLVEDRPTTIQPSRIGLLEVVITP
jgi:hypothetical protein